MAVITDWPDLLSDERLERLALRACGQRQAGKSFVVKMQKIADRVVAENLLRPAVAWRCLEIETIASDHLKLADSGQILFVDEAEKLFAGASHIIATVQTLGPVIGEAIEELYQQRRMADMMAMEQVAVSALFSLSEQAFEAMTNLKDFTGQDFGSPLNPGDDGFDFDAQRQLHALAGADRIGVMLEDSGMLTPVKSLSSIIALGTGVPRWDRTSSCARCKAADKCRFRQQSVI